MGNNIQFEGACDMDSWPTNVPGKLTQAAVFGLYHPTKGKCCEVLWTGQFPALEQAMYWGAKKEMEAVRKGKWIIASRVLWQHELSPEQAVEATRRKMQPQIDQAIAQMAGGVNPTFPESPGGLRQVRPGDGHGMLIEVDDPDDPDAGFSAWMLPEPRKP